MTAPFSAPDLADALRPLAGSRVLPREAYTSADVFAFEQDRFFAGGWTCLGRREELARRGRQVCLPVGRLTVLLAFADEGPVALANICRHRGHELLPAGASSDRASVVCPYHAWSYRLDGSLLGAPGFREVAGFDPAEFGLAPLPLVDWHGWLFCNADAGAAAFSEHVGALDELIAPYSPEGLQLGARHDYVVAANWKVVSENYHECYHCPLIHPELCRVSPPASGSNFDLPGEWVGGVMALRDGAQTMSLDGRSGGGAIAGLAGERLRSVLYVQLFPDLLVSAHPDYVMTHRLVPLAPDGTAVECSWYFPAEVAGAAGFDPSWAVDFWDLTNRQDWAACESVQRNLASPLFVPGPLAPNEDAVHRFVTMVAQGYLAADTGAASGAR